MDDPVPNLAMGYTKSEGKWKSNIFMHTIRGGPAGGGFSTAEDLLAFANALMGNKLLEPTMTRLLTTAKPELHSPNYGFGFAVDQNPHSIGHSGGFPGISSNLSVFPDSGYTLAVMSNIDGGSMEVVNLFRHMLSLRARQRN
jgi:CubicO group peptidase (beta-lactamase class C family)